MVFTLIFPSKTFDGATNGLLLWFQTILPTLLPFIILSNLLINTHSIPYICEFISPFFCRFFRISKPASYAVLIGFLCGYPMGAKTINDLIKTKDITRREGQYLLSFCNNASPMFIISFIVTQNFCDMKYLLGTLCILFLSPILCSFIFRRYYQMSNIQLSEKEFPNSPFTFNFSIVDTSIMNGFETITKIGGYIILFSILTQYMDASPLIHFSPILELSNGILNIMNLSYPFPILYTLVLTLTSFGGLCAIAQTGAMLKDSKISIYPYITQKLITTMITSFLAYIYIYFIHQ